MFFLNLPNMNPMIDQFFSWNINQAGVKENFEITSLSHSMYAYQNILLFQIKEVSACSIMTKIKQPTCIHYEIILFPFYVLQINRNHLCFLFILFCWFMIMLNWYVFCYRKIMEPPTVVALNEFEQYKFKLNQERKKKEQKQKTTLKIIPKFTHS